MTRQYGSGAGADLRRVRHVRGLAREHDPAHGAVRAAGGDSRTRGAAQYQPQLETVRSGRRPWVNLDVLHRIGLDIVLAELGIDLPERYRHTLVRAWHRLDPWPDVVAGLTTLKETYIIAPCSNGHIAQSVNLAKYAKLPWDAILGAEIARAYKPDPRVYRRQRRRARARLRRGLHGRRPQRAISTAAARGGPAHGVRAAPDRGHGADRRLGHRGADVRASSPPGEASDRRLGHRHRLPFFGGRLLSKSNLDVGADRDAAAGLAARRDPVVRVRRDRRRRPPGRDARRAVRHAHPHAQHRRRSR